MSQIIFSLAAAVFLALASVVAGTVLPLILLSLASACAWVQYIPGLSYQWQARAVNLGLGLYALALAFTLYAWLELA